MQNRGGWLRSASAEHEDVVEMAVLVGCPIALKVGRLGFGWSRRDPVVVLLPVMVGERVRRHPAGLGQRSQEQNPAHPATRR